MQWVIGDDIYPFDSVGDAILMDFKNGALEISQFQTVGHFSMEGSNTSICDNEGNLLFYSNGCKIMNRRHEVMANGDSIDQSLIQYSWCPTGGDPLTQGVLALPAVEDECLHYVFNLDFVDTYPIDTLIMSLAPQHLYYQVVDMSRDSGYGEVILKNQIAVQDTFARGNIQATRHANGSDWWVIVPKSHSNCYFLTLLTADGVQSPQLSCSGNIWSDKDTGTHTVFTPDGKKYIRFNWWDGLNIFDFNNQTGELSNPTVIYFPNDIINYMTGVAVSPNSRFLYASARNSVYQFDLEAPDIESSKVLIAEYDGYSNPNPTRFNLAALAPDGKIYISTFSHAANLHVINNPDLPGIACDLVQHGIELPILNYNSIPNLPNYRNQTTPMDCDSIYVSSTEPKRPLEFAVFPNPTDGMITVEGEEYGSDLVFEVHDFFGRVVKRIDLGYSSTRHQIPLDGLPNGQYFYCILKDGQRVSTGKFIKLG